MSDRVTRESKGQRRGHRPFTALAILVLAVVFTGSLPAQAAQTLSDAALGQIRFEQKPGNAVSPGLNFTDEQGRSVQLGQYFGQKPMILVLGYYGCPMLCTLVLNGMVESAADMKWSIGRDFEVVNVSIDPSETPALAAAKKRTYLKRYGRFGAGDGWHFLTGKERAIRQLTDEVGFRFAYDAASKQYAHPSGLVVLTPDGKVSRYLFGVIYPSRDLYAALRGASSHQVGSIIRQVVLLCFHYNPITGKYSATIMDILRMLGIATILGIAALVIVSSHRHRSDKTGFLSQADGTASLASSQPAEGAPQPATEKTPGP